MRVRVLFFGMLKDLAGKSSDALDLPEGASVRDVLEHYQAQVPRLREWLPLLAVALNQEYAEAGMKLKENDEIALLPPVSGGGPEESGGRRPRSRSGRRSHVLQNRRDPSTSSGQAVGHPMSSLSAGQRPRAAIVRDRIDTQSTLARLKCGDDGAAVVFEGVVRNQTRGRKTLYLEYEVYEAMALREMESLAAQALEQFRIRDVALVHRLGRLEIGETSVLIAVVSAHRAAAFDACRWLIDTLKRTVPIWKKEYFVDGAVWADGEPFPAEIPRANSQSGGSPATGSASK